jgi:DNA-binding response OmpR family regulator
MKPPEQTETSASTLAHASDATAPEATPAPRQTILLVEDDHAIRRYLEVILQKAGYTVITANDGLEAMKVALTIPVDAVVTDAIMPHLSGHELCRFLRHQTRLSRLPVILLSGLENSAAATAAKEDGADVYLCKPVSPQHLINCLEQLL